MNFKVSLSGFPQGFLKQLSWQYVATLSVVIFGFIQTILIANKLGASQLGIIALAASLTTIISIFFNFNLKDVVIRYVNIFTASDKLRSADNVLFISVLLNFILSIVYFIVIYFLAPILNDLIIKADGGEDVIRLYSFVLIFQFMLTDSILGYIRLRHALHVYAAAQFLSSLLRLLAVFIGLWYFQMGIFFVVAVNGITAFLTFSILFIKSLRILSTENRQFSGRPWQDKEIANSFPSIGRFVRNNYITGLLAIPSKELDMSILGLFTTTENVGIYKVAKNFIASIWAIADPIHLVIYPECAKFWAKADVVGLYKFVQKVTYFLIAFSALIIIGSWIAVPFFIDIFIGQEFSYASILFMIMVSSTIFWMPLLWVQPVFLATDRTDLALKVAFIHSVISTLMYFGLIYQFGLLGVAIAYALNSTVLALLKYYYVTKSRVLKLSS